MSIIGNNVAGSGQTIPGGRSTLIIDSTYTLTAAANEEVTSFSIMNLYQNLGKSVEIGIYDITSDAGDGIYDSSFLVGSTETIAGTDDIDTLLTTGTLATSIPLTEGHIYAVGCRPDLDFFTQTAPWNNDVAVIQNTLTLPDPFIASSTDDYTKHFFATTEIGDPVTGTVTIECNAAFNEGNADYTVDPVIVSSVLGFNVGMSVILDMGLASEIIAFPVSAIDTLPTANPRISATFSEPIGTKTVHVVYNAETGDIQSVTGEKPLGSVTFEVTAAMICDIGLLPTWRSTGATFSVEVSDTTAKSIDMLSLYLVDTGGSAIVSVALASGTLPNTFSLNTTDGFITGNNAETLAGNFPFTLTVTNADGHTSVPSPVFDFDIIDSTLAAPSIDSVQAIDGSDVLYVNLSEVLKVSAVDPTYKLGTSLTVNGGGVTYAYTSGVGTNQLVYTMVSAVTAGDVISFSYDNTVTNSDLTGVASDLEFANATVGMTVVVIAAGWTMTRDFESFDVGTDLDGIAGGFNLGSAIGGTYVVSSPTFAGSRAAEANIPADTNVTWGGALTFPTALVKGDSIWVKVSIRVPAGFSFTTGTEGNKFMRIQVVTSGNANVGYHHNNIQGNHVVGAIGGLYVGGEVIDSVGDTIFQNVSKDILRGTDLKGAGDIAHIMADTYHTVEEHVYFDERQNVGIRRTWWDGQLVVNDMVTGTLNKSTDKSTRLLILNYWNAPLPSTPQKVYLDDITITSATPTTSDANGYPYLGI